MDWLEVKLPTGVVFRPEVAAIIREERQSFRRSEHYDGVIDLRKYDVADAMLHYSKRRGEHTHKLQLIGTGQFSFKQNCADIEAVVTSNPLTLQPMRTDLTADVQDIPMSWVYGHVRAEHKRFSNKVTPDVTPELSRGNERTDKESLLAMGTRGVQTIYIGKRPNCFRFYDKTEERLQAYRKFVRGWKPSFLSGKKFIADITAMETGAAFVAHETECFERGLDPDQVLYDRYSIRTSPENLRLLAKQQADFARHLLTIPKRPSFEQFCGLQETDCITRFERMMGAQEVKKIHLAFDERKIPLFGSLRELRDNVTDFNPFAPISFAEAGSACPALPNGSNYSLWDYAAAMWFREKIMREGMHDVERWGKPLAGNHWDDRILRKLKDFKFLPSDDSGAAKLLDHESLYERYRNAITQQLAA
jgi:hypothetical protein